MRILTVVEQGFVIRVQAIYTTKIILKQITDTVLLKILKGICWICVSEEFVSAIDIQRFITIANDVHQRELCQVYSTRKFTVVAAKCAAEVLLQQRKAAKLRFVSIIGISYTENLQMELQQVNCTACCET